MNEKTKNDYATRMLYGENSDIEYLDCTKCLCVKCGKLYAEVLPDRCLDIKKLKILTVEQAKNLNIWDGLSYTENVFCAGCRKMRALPKDEKLETLGFLFFILAILAMSIWWSIVGADK